MEPRSIVLGLGNPGQRYRKTRHNVGFRVLDRMAADAGVSFAAEGELRARAWVAEPDGPVVLAKPRTYMNRSGRAAAALCRHYGVEAESLLVIYDDADLELGRLRIRPDGGAGGHNGVRSLIESLGTSMFARLRLGVRGVERDDRELADYVLDEFAEEEEPQVERVVALAAEAATLLLERGVAEAMNAYNGRLVPRSDEDEQTQEATEG